MSRPAEPVPIGLTVCETCGGSTRVADAGLCRSCDADFLRSPVVPGPRPERCARCHDHGFLASADRRSFHECPCLSDARRVAMEADLVSRLAAAGAPARFLSLPAIELQGHGSVFLWGASGSGKTRLSTQALKGALREPRFANARFCSLSDLTDARMTAMRQKLEDPVHELRVCSYLVLDDVVRGREVPTEYQLEGLWSIVDKRYAMDLPTVFTSEVNQRDLAIMFNSGKLPTGPPLARRIAELCGTNIQRGPFTVRQ